MLAIGRIMGALTLVVVGTGNVAAMTAPGTNTSAPTTATPTTPVTTSPVHPVNADYSTPVATLKTLLTAAQQGDFATVRESMIIIPKAHDDVNVFLDALAATARLQAAAEAKFGPAGAQRFGKPTAAELAERLNRLNPVMPKVDNDTATLEVPPDPASGQQGQTVQLIKIANQWKVRGEDYFRLPQDSPEKNRERLALSRRISAIADVVAKEITAGKYYSSAMAYQEYWTLCMQTTKPSAGNTATTTAPINTPRPSSAPAGLPEIPPPGVAETNSK